MNHPMFQRTVGIVLALLAATTIVGQSPTAPVLPETRPLRMRGDIAAALVKGADQFLLREIDQSAERRAAFFDRDFASEQNYNKSLQSNRARLAHILGLRDPRENVTDLELISTTRHSALVGRGEGFQVFAVRWPALRNIEGEGLLLVPERAKPVANVIAIPDADQLPEMICGLLNGVDASSQFARRLAEQGCRVVVPLLINRQMAKRAPPGQRPRANLTNREYLYRPAFELGRHLIGYELQKILAAVDWFDRSDSETPVGVIGYGEGGMLALYAGAVDTRIDAVCVSGYFGPRENIWEQPIDRNVFGLLQQFGDAELASMIFPRGIVVDSATAPEMELPSEGGAPARLAVPDYEAVGREVDRARSLVPQSFSKITVCRESSPTDGSPVFCGSQACRQLLAMLGSKRELEPLRGTPDLVLKHDLPSRQQRQIQQIDDHNQWLLAESPYVRRAFMNIGLTSHDGEDNANQLDTSSTAAYEASVERFRDYFRHEVIGHFESKRLPHHARSRLVYDEPTWNGYEVVLDVFPDVIAYGILCVPKGIQPGDRRAVVVCQHGLEGRPQDVIQGDHRAFHDFAAKLADEGFVTFAPQNLYIGGDAFRTLQRKANPIKKTLFSLIVPQHQQILDWLKTLPYVDADRIAFYGLSYGGKSAMRIPPLVTDYCLSICSADFNEWVWKNASNRSRYSYVFTKEYEIFEFDLGSTFNYAEMAALIAPRPFMVERGHFDGVAPDETVGYEFAKVRHLYAARLNLPDHCRIEWFVGPHTIHGQGTFEFLRHHLGQ